MTHIYSISGMTCSGCETKVKGLLSSIPSVKNVAIDLKAGSATIEMDRHVATGTLQDALKDYPKYQLSEKTEEPEKHEEVAAPQTSWLKTYKPILLIFTYILILS